MSKADKPTFSDRWDALNLKILRGSVVQYAEESYVLAETSIRLGLAYLERLTADESDVERRQVPASRVSWPDPFDSL